MTTRLHGAGVGLSHGEILAALLYVLIERDGGSVTVAATEFWASAAVVKRRDTAPLRIRHDPGLGGHITFAMGGR